MATPVRHMQEPTVWQKCKMGALMGGGVGLTIGFIFGSYSILRSGAGPRGFLATLSQYMLSSAATFSFFLAIGSVRVSLGSKKCLHKLRSPWVSVVKIGYPE
ncbi:hypothetical protein PISMIDRAFT_675846 [Pisolithus microcarpus 441]|uniref:Protein MGR2 n=1 Tax=Pisolithus microcarpus 441 TaxID=765257 RepID=A0A0C9ZKI1_9AGAM|nr:hypothetical protein PISMIDRAFT_675846 [Pisolithus microcarpus 441]